MRTQSWIRIVMAGVLLGAGWCYTQPAASAATPQRGAFSLGSLSGVFTVTDFKTLNGVSTAAGWLTATVTDTSGTNQIGTFTNFPVRMPVSGIMSGGPISLAVDDPVVLPTLSTNTCDILGVVVGAIDVTAPGIGLNVHVNQISLVVRADRATTIGDLLCNVLGNNGLLGRLNVASADAGSAGAMGTAATASPNPVLTMGQLQGLVGILLGANGGGSTSAGATSSSALSQDNAKLQVQDIIQRVATTMEAPRQVAPSKQPVAQ